MTEAGPPVLIGVLKMSESETSGFGGVCEGNDEAFALADVEVAIETTVVGNGWTLLCPLVSRLVCTVWKTA